METKKLNNSLRVKYYQIDDINNDFETLSAAKKHFWLYSSQEIIKNFYPKTYICGYNFKGELISITTVVVNSDGTVHFSSTVHFI